MPASAPGAAPQLPAVAAYPSASPCPACVLQDHRMSGQSTHGDTEAQSVAFGWQSHRGWGQGSEGPMASGRRVSTSCLSFPMRGETPGGRAWSWRGGNPGTALGGPRRVRAALGLQAALVPTPRRVCQARQAARPGRCAWLSSAVSFAAEKREEKRVQFLSRSTHLQSWKFY